MGVLAFAKQDISADGAAQTPLKASVIVQKRDCDIARPAKAQKGSGKRIFSEKHDGIDLMSGDGRFFLSADGNAKVFIAVVQVAFRRQNVERLQHFFHALSASSASLFNCRQFKLYQLLESV